MAMSQDVKRGMLGVPGGPYSLLLPRSKDFGVEFVILKLRYCDPVDRVNMMQVLQMLWDRGEPAGYMTSISRDPMPDTQPHEVSQSSCCVVGGDEKEGYGGRYISPERY